MRTVLRILIGLLLGYAAGAAFGLALVTLGSTNGHDIAIEAVMTAAFVAGPLGAIAGAATAILSGKRRGPRGDGS